MASRADNVISFEDAKNMSSRGSSRSGSSYNGKSAGQNGANRANGSVRSAYSAAASGSQSRYSNAAAYPTARSYAQSQNSGKLTTDGLFDDPLFTQENPRAAVSTFEVEEGTRDSRKSRSESKRKQRNKAKADKMFQRQFGDESAAPSEGAPRAAVYEGKMGRRHKKAFEDLGGKERAKSPAASVKAPKKRGFFTSPGWFGVPRIANLFGICAIIAIVCLFLYPTAQTYYLELRDSQRLQAEADVLAERNAEIQAGIDSLSTDEGIEDAAREELGWVNKGETAGVVTGLDDDSSSDSSDVNAQIVAGSIPAPDTWYSGVLDQVFNYPEAVEAVTSSDAMPTDEEE